VGRDSASQQCLAHWAEHGLPLVVTTQRPCVSTPGHIEMGLSMPKRWGRKRLSLSVPRGHVLYFDEFPRIEQVGPLLPVATRSAWKALCSDLRQCDAVARVQGSYGWQHLSGLCHVRPESDLDLWIAVSSAEHADEVTRRLQAFSSDALRLDGELVFERGHAIAWREWLAWREGRTKSVLLKHIGGGFISKDPLRDGMAAEAAAHA
jgi:phosphoribosyl-dephospho-CoA transferase